MVSCTFEYFDQTTTGFIGELNQFHSTHVPAPIRLADHIGNDTPANRCFARS
jgi:hypothetical protein